jgi:hypothetical protein
MAKHEVRSSIAADLMSVAQQLEEVNESYRRLRSSLSSGDEISQSRLWFFRGEVNKLSRTLTSMIFALQDLEEGAKVVELAKKEG